MNNQPPEKRVIDSNGLLEVHSIFNTIQGEGPFCGTPAVFVRLAGCNLQCPACDTEYTSNRVLYDPERILKEIKKYRSEGLVVITGGEPFRQNLTPLLDRLVGTGFYVQIETNGTLSPSKFQYTTLPDIRTGAYVVCSPKTGRIHPEILKVACCLKYVANANEIVSSDGLPKTALGHSAGPGLARPPLGWHRPVYLQPQDDKDPEFNYNNLKAVITSCMENGHILQLQVHKLINME